MVKEKIYNKLIQHDKLFIRIDKRFEDVDRRFEQVDMRFEQVDRRFDRVEGRLDQHDLQLKAIIEKLLDHDDRFDNLEETMHAGFRQVNDSLEQIITIVQRLDQERIFTVQWLKRLDDKVENHEIKIAEHDSVLKQIAPDVRPV